MSLTVKNNNPHLIEMFGQMLCNHAEIGNVHHIFELLRGPQFPTLLDLRKKVFTEIQQFEKYDITLVGRKTLFDAVSSVVSAFPPPPSETEQQVPAEEDPSRPLKRRALETKKGPQWQDLPDAVRQGMIFSFLDDPQDIVQLARVNRYFQRHNFAELSLHLQRTCSSNLGWINKYAKAFHVRNLSDVSHIFPNFAPKTNELWLGESTISDAELADFCMMPNLTTIILNGCPQLTNTGFAQLPVKFPNLTALLLDKTTVSDHALSQLAQQLPGLRKINLNLCEFISNPGVETITNKLPHLEELMIRYCKVSTNALKSIVDNCSKLTALNICIHGEFRHLVSDTFVSALTKKNQNLTILTLSYSPITDVALQSIGENCKQLHTLWLEDTKITSKGIICIIDQCQELTYINIRMCNAVDRTGHMYLGKGPKLKKVVLADRAPFAATGLAKMRPDIDAGPLNAQRKNEFAYEPKTEAGKMYRSALEELVVAATTQDHSFVGQMSDDVTLGKVHNLETTIKMRRLCNLSDADKVRFDEIWRNNCKNLDPENHLTRTADTLFVLDQNALTPERTL